MHRNNKQKYYILNYLKLIIPDFFFRIRLNIKLKNLTNYDYDHVKLRVNYYNKLQKKIYLLEKNTLMFIQILIISVY